MPANTDFDDFDDFENDEYDGPTVGVSDDPEDEVRALEAKLAAARRRADQAQAEDGRNAPAASRRPNRKQRRSAGRIPPNAPKPQDRKPKKEQSTGREDEAESGTLEFDFNGVTYTAPVAGRTRGLVSAMEDQSVRRILLAIIGQEQYEEFLETDPYDSEYMELFRAWGKAAGFRNLGN